MQCMFRPVALAALVMLAASCAVPPPSAYVTTGGKAAAQLSIGTNAVGEQCSLQSLDDGGGAVYCGTWQQPSAKLRPAKAATAAQLPQLATASIWRDGIDQRFACQPPVATTILGGQPAELLQCTEKRGGWPHVAMVALVGDRAWYADGVLPAATAMERAIGVRAGIIKGGVLPPGSAADGLLAERMAAQSISSGDIGQFDGLMAAGTRANLADNPAAAEVAFRAALALQRKALGQDNPNTADAVMTLALQLSNEGRLAEASSLFAQAERFAPSAADTVAPARLLHYRGLDALNRKQVSQGLALLKAADDAYAALVPFSVRAPVAKVGGARDSVVTNEDLVTDPIAQSALVGLVEVRRFEALTLHDLGRLEESESLLASTTRLAQANGLLRPGLAARLYRTRGVAAAQAGDTQRALDELRASVAAFDHALPDSKPLADTALLQAGELVRSGRTAEALPVCQSGISALVALRASTTPMLMAPCLDALGATVAASHDKVAQQKLLATMFVAAQLAQGGITSQQIAQATARLQENARDPHVAEAIRRRQDLNEKLHELYGQRDDLIAAAQGRAADTAAIDAQIKATQLSQADADAALQAASPNFGQLAQQVVQASDVFAALQPDEALVMIAVGPRDGWTLVLRNGAISASKVAAGGDELAKQVAALRGGIELTDKLPSFNVAAAQQLYQLTLAPEAAALDGVKDLVVAPAGPLLAMPFEVLLTGPADPAHLADAPWLVRRYTIAHVPAAGNFVTLRRIAGGSRAPRPWFGFGDFVPVGLAQAQHSFSDAACRNSAALLADLPQLPFARKELDAARLLLGASPGDELLGHDFTVPAVMKVALKDYRILHFAAHALLPAELQCQSEPAIVTSDPAGAADASQALLTASDVTQLDLDADLVILSACNSGGGGGGTAGESLSGLARAFFFAGARSLMVTHWSVNDQVAAFLVADTLQRLRKDPALGPAGALRAAQLSMLDAAGKTLPAEVAHPFFWAPFAVIGAGGGIAPPAQQASLQRPSGL